MRKFHIIQFGSGVLLPTISFTELGKGITNTMPEKNGYVEKAVTGFPTETVTSNTAFQLIPHCRLGEYLFKRSGWEQVKLLIS